MSDDTETLAEVLAAHQRSQMDGGRCICGAWPPAAHDVEWTRHLAEALEPVIAARIEQARAGEDALRHECGTGPLCDGWPFGVDDAYRTIAAVSWPAERKENRDGWAVTMRHRADLFEQEARRACERLEAPTRRETTGVSAGTSPLRRCLACGWMSASAYGDHLAAALLPVVEQAVTEALAVMLWHCPDCAFGFDALHTDPGGGYSCPLCGELAAERQRSAAWDEGYDMGYGDRLFEDRGLFTDPDADEYPHANPYRADTIATTEEP